MDDDLRFFFDLNGWVLLPGVLSEPVCRAVREHLLADGSPFTGPAQELLDHPAVTPLLHGILADQAPQEDAWMFRCENAFASIRSAGWSSPETQRPHVVLPARRGGPMTYHCRNGRIYAGLVRVVWELNPVRQGMGGTLFLSGTHKAEFPFPAAVQEPDNAHMQSYACPAGSAFVFSESLLHASTAWRDPDHQRVSLFGAYNSVWAQWHRLNLAPDVIAAMPPRRQSLFRGVYALDFQRREANLRYAPDNRAL